MIAKHRDSPSIDELRSVDLSAVALPTDKIGECDFFLELATQESDRSRFRWLISAFLNAVYSYFEIKALHAYEAYSNPDSREYIEDVHALDVLRRYIRIVQDKKKSSYVKTSGLEGSLELLYQLRMENTHHYPLAIMESEVKPPEGYQFGCLPDKGTPALEFCRNVMSLIEQIEAELGRNAL